MVLEKSLLKDKETTGNKSDSETDPKVTPHNVDEGTNIQDSHSRELANRDVDSEKNTEIDNKDNRSRKMRSKDIDSENNSDTNNSNISSEQLSPEDNEIIRNNTDVETDPIASPENDKEESTNKHNISELLTNNDEENNIVDNISPILMNNDNNHDDSTNTDNEIMETRKSILLLGMSTVDVQEIVETKGSTNILVEILTTTARQCVIRRIISINDGRDFAQINSINCYNKSNVYTVSLVNTNPFKDTSSNPTVYDTNRHLNTDYNCQHFLSSLESMLCVGNQKVQFHEMAFDYYNMPAVSSDLSKLFSVY